MTALPRHGVDHWDLVEYEWDPETNVATLVYEHDDGRTCTVREHFRVDGGSALEVVA